MKNTMKTKKTVFAVLAALTLIGAGTAASLAFPQQSIRRTAEAASVQAAVQIKASTCGGGQIAKVNGKELEFNGLNAFTLYLEKGETVTFSAKADEGYTFLYWIDCTSEQIISKDEEVTVHADKAYDLYAIFDLDGEAVELRAEAAGEGYVAGANEGEEPETNDDEQFTSVTLYTIQGKNAVFTAQAKEGYRFVYWYDNNAQKIYSEDERIEIKADEDLTLTAFFDLEGEPVKVEANVEGDGMIDGANCGMEPEIDADLPMTKVFLNVIKGKDAVFIAQAKEGSRFVKWINADTKEVISDQERITVAPEEALTLTAVFEKA